MTDIHDTVITLHAGYKGKRAHDPRAEKAFGIFDNTIKFKISAELTITEIKLDPVFCKLIGTDMDSETFWVCNKGLQWETVISTFSLNSIDHLDESVSIGLPFSQGYAWYYRKYVLSLRIDEFIVPTFEIITFSVSSLKYFRFPDPVESKHHLGLKYI